MDKCNNHKYLWLLCIIPGLVVVSPCFCLCDVEKKSPHSEYNCCIFYSNVLVELDLNVIKSDQFCVIF